MSSDRLGRIASDPKDSRPSDLEGHQHRGQGYVRACSIDLEDGWCHSHRMYCTLAGAERGQADV